MGFVDLRGRTGQSGHRDAAHGQVALESMAGLVGQHVHVRGGAVEVGEDEGRLVGSEPGHVSAQLLSGPGFQVKELVFLHEIEELAGFGAHFPVHLLGLVHQFLRGTDGQRVAFRELQLLVVEADTVNAQVFLLAFPDGGHGRGHNLPDLLPEVGGVLLGIVKAVPFDIGHVGIGFKAHLLRLGIPKLNQFRILLVQFRADLFIQLRPGFESFLPLLPIRAFHMLEQAVEVALLAPEIRLGLCGGLAVFLAEFALPDHFRDNPFVGCQQVRVQHAEHLFTELRLKILPEGGRGQGFLPGVFQRSQHG